MNPEIKKVDARRSLIVPGDAKITLQFCVEHFINCYQISVKRNDRFCVALSGGSTPKAIYEKLCSDPFVKQINWKKCWLFWSDERCVSPESSESNFRMAMEAGFKNMEIPQNQIFRMRGELSHNTAANEYNELVQKHVPNGFDLMMLGLGEDGHTASLFPNTDGLQVEDRYAIANFVPEKNSWRLTLTFSCINQSKNIIFYVLGEKKRAILKKVLSSSDTFPAQKVGTEQHNAIFISDLKSVI